MNTIQLQFSNATVALAGNPYGKKVFEEQVRPKIDSLDDDTTIVLPSQIEFVTSSFIQGFFDTWLHHYGVENTKKHVKIDAANKSVVDYIWDNIQ